MSPIHRLIGASIVIFGCFLGCQKTPSPVESLPSKTEPVSKNTLTADLIKLKRELTIERRSNENTANNLSAYNTTLEQTKRRHKSLRMYEHIPKKPQIRLFKAQLMETTTNGVTIETIKISSQKQPSPELPKSTNEAYEWQFEQLATAYSVEIELSALTKRSVLRWHNALTRQLPRLFLINKAREIPGGWHMSGYIYSYLEATIPRHTPNYFNLRHRLDKLGYDKLLPRSPLDVTLIADCERLNTSIIKDLTQVEAALIPLARNHYLNARFRFFRDRVSAVEQASVSELLEK